MRILNNSLEIIIIKLKYYIEDRKDNLSEACVWTQFFKNKFALSGGIAELLEVQQVSIS